MEPAELYKKLFLECNELCKSKPLTYQIRPKVEKLLDELDSVWNRLGYRERELISNWCASQSEWIDE